MVKCRDCGKYHGMDNKYFCPKCQERADRREKFRGLMSQLETIANLPDNPGEGRFMSGFSWYEQERFSLIFMKLQRKHHWPKEFEDFVNNSTIKDAKEVLKYEIHQKEQLNKQYNILYDCGKCFTQVSISLMKKNGKKNQNWDDLACPHCGSSGFLIKQLK